MIHINLSGLVYLIIKTLITYNYKITNFYSKNTILKYSISIFLNSKNYQKTNQDLNRRMREV